MSASHSGVAARSHGACLIAARDCRQLNSVNSNACNPSTQPVHEAACHRHDGVILAALRIDAMNVPLQFTLMNNCIYYYFIYLAQRRHTHTATTFTQTNTYNNHTKPHASYHHQCGTPSNSVPPPPPIPSLFFNTTNPPPPGCVLSTTRSTTAYHRNTVQ